MERGRGRGCAHGGIVSACALARVLSAALLGAVIFWFICPTYATSLQLFTYPLFLPLWVFFLLVFYVCMF